MCSRVPSERGEHRVSRVLDGSTSLLRALRRTSLAMPDPTMSGAGVDAAQATKMGPGAQLPTSNDPFEWAKQIRARTPTLLEVGKKAPKCVLSFGGAGFLATYSLGVALYLQREQPKLLAESYLLGSGTGIFPALALACGPQVVDIEKLRDAIIAQPFRVWREDQRRQVVREAAEKFVPENVAALANGRCCATVGMSTSDHGYNRQPPPNQLFGCHIATFDNKKDTVDLIVAATCPNHRQPCAYRGLPVTRGTWRSLSSELDQYVRHIHIHGYAGFRNMKQHTRHNFYFGRHGTIVNCAGGPLEQLWLCSAPYGGADKLRDAFDRGFNDARRYERWVEDPYHFAKPDRSAGSDGDWREIRAAVFGQKAKTSAI